MDGIAFSGVLASGRQGAPVGSEAREMRSPMMQTKLFMVIEGRLIRPVVQRERQFSLGFVT